MAYRTVGELIAEAYTLSPDNFDKVCPDPVLIGVGILDALLFQQQFP